jgi:hypothetical protein
MATCFITIEGVLGEHSVAHGFYPIPDGIRLAHALRSGYRLVLGTVQQDPGPVEHWLLVNGMHKPGFYGELLYRQFSDSDDATLQAEHAASLRAQGAEVDLVVSGDPETILQVTQQGIPAILFTNPAYRWAQYRPDRKKLPRAWQDIDAEIVHQRELQAMDPRLSDEEQVERI